MESNNSRPVDDIECALQVSRVLKDVGVLDKVKLLLEAGQPLTPQRLVGFLQETEAPPPPTPELDINDLIDIPDDETVGDVDETVDTETEEIDRPLVTPERLAGSLQETEAPAPPAPEMAVIDFVDIPDEAEAVAVAVVDDTVDTETEQVDHDRDRDDDEIRPGRSSHILRSRESSVVRDQDSQFPDCDELVAFAPQMSTKSSSLKRKRKQKEKTVKKKVKTRKEPAELRYCRKCDENLMTTWLEFAEHWKGHFKYRCGNCIRFYTNHKSSLNHHMANNCVGRPKVLTYLKAYSLEFPQ